MSYDDWLDESEYPTDQDMDDFGDDSPVDYDPLTFGYLGDSQSRFWTTKRIVLSIIVLVILAAWLLPQVL